MFSQRYGAVRESWSQRVARANELARMERADAHLLAFYGDLLKIQQDAYDVIRTRLGKSASGSLRQDLATVRQVVPPLLKAISEQGPEALALEANRLLAEHDSRIVDAMLIRYWHEPSDREFFAKAALQPYASWLADATIVPTDRGLARADNRCPFCGGSAQLSILHTPSDTTGGGRALLCATCLTPWPFRRVVCVSCGEEDDRKLAYFHAPDFDHLRVDACDSCRHYLKAVDLTRLGRAIPVVDEIAGAPLDVWAREHGYEKIELNLLGL
jgi:formate dehydrogenase accessory protein FdhE